MVGRGSLWHRWDPHLHAPGTILNDQFKGPNAWEEFLAAVETSNPKISALGITDYYVTDSYEALCVQKANGRLENVELIFPNVEMRLSIGTKAGSGINIHLLVDPTDVDHLDELKRFVGRLHFEALGDKFACTKADLIKLGQKTKPGIGTDAAALEQGVTQFKVNFTQLRTEYMKSDWAKDNILIAIAAGKNDGTSGIQENSFEATRVELERLAHIIFAAQPAQRQFWLGLGPLSANEIRRKYRSLKPCLHGSDAHSAALVGKPTNDRFSWVKGSVTFDALRQAAIEPAGRAYVGEQPPPAGIHSLTLDRIEVENAPWLAGLTVPFNPGLVTIIGARGSGKTALADMVAAASHVFQQPASDRSFLERAKPLLGNAEVRALWGEGDKTSIELGDYVLPDGWDSSKVRYLSQQFVDRLCSAEGMNDELLAEIERVIFQAHSRDDRGEAFDFADLLEIKSRRFREARARLETSLATASSDLAAAREKLARIDSLKRQIKDKEVLIQQYTAERTRLVGKGSEERAKRLEELTTAAEKVRRAIRNLEAREQSLAELNDEIQHTRTTESPQRLRDTEERYPNVGFNTESWSSFLLDYRGNVDSVIGAGIKSTTDFAKKLRDGDPAIEDAAPTPAKAEDAHVSPGEDLALIALTRLDSEIGRLQQQVGADQEMSSRYTAISSKILAEQTALGRLQESLKDAEKAKETVREITERRTILYRDIFSAIIDEENVLRSLYRPLGERLRGSEGTLSKLSFSVARDADLDKWADRGESLLDLRKAAPFRGKGSLKAAAKLTLVSEWESGSADQVSTAMSEFREKNDQKFLDHAPSSTVENIDEYRAWSKSLAQWLYSTDHINLRYTIQYDGIEIERLSPGTRGIVLLLLYLGLDDDDMRPLIIDQPEENLDPKSIFDELVPLFIQAKTRRQVIMVTHNANLVVNTDADQVIIAHCGTHVVGQLPSITYEGGGLEDAAVRRAVIGILEGGEEAFRERARRLRVTLVS